MNPIILLPSMDKIVGQIGSIAIIGQLVLEKEKFQIQNLGSIV